MLSKYKNKMILELILQDPKKFEKNDLENLSFWVLHIIYKSNIKKRGSLSLTLINVWNDVDDEARRVWLLLFWIISWACILIFLSHFVPFVGLDNSAWITVPYWLFSFGWCVGVAFLWMGWTELKFTKIFYLLHKLCEK